MALVTLPAAILTAALTLVSAVNEVTPDSYTKAMTSLTNKLVYSTFHRIVQQAGIDPHTQIVIDEDPSQNAFAGLECASPSVSKKLAGNYLCAGELVPRVTVTQGFVDYFKTNPDAALLVLGHEVGHIAHGDIYGGSYDDNPSVVNVNQESLADDYGWNMLMTLGGNPCKALELWHDWFLRNPEASLYWKYTNEPDHPSDYDRFQKGAGYCLSYTYAQSNKNSQK